MDHVVHKYWHLSSQSAAIYKSPFCTTFRTNFSYRYHNKVCLHVRVQSLFDYAQLSAVKPHLTIDTTIYLINKDMFLE